MWFIEESSFAKEVYGYNNKSVITFLALKELARELNVSADIIKHWLQYGVWETDRCFPALKKLFPELEPKRVNPGVYIEPPESMNPHVMKNKFFVEEDFVLKKFTSR